MVDRAEFIFVLQDQTGGGGPPVGGVPATGGAATSAMEPKGTVPPPRPITPPVITEAEKPILAEAVEPILAQAIPTASEVADKAREARSSRIREAATAAGVQVAAQLRLGGAVTAGRGIATGLGGIISNPATLAAGAAVALPLAATAALTTAVRAGGRRASELQQFSGAISAAAGREQVRQVRRGLEGAENLGPILSRLIDERGELATAIGRIGDTIAGPFFDLAVEVLDGINRIATPIGELFEEHGDTIGQGITTGLKANLAALPGGKLFLLWSQINKFLGDDDARKAMGIFEFLATDKFIDPPAEFGIVQENEAPFNPVVAGIPGAL